MQFTAGQIAEFLQGEVDGNAQVLVHDVAKIEEGRSGTLTFLANLIYTEHVYTTAASVVIVGRDFHPTKSIPKHLTLIRVDDPRAAFARFVNARVRPLTADGPYRGPVPFRRQPCRAFTH